MDPQHRALHMREQLKQIYRARLPDMGWCDDNTRRKQQVDGAYSQVRDDWEAEASHYQSVAADALEASTTDNEHQTIDMTMPNDRSFWSSSGHPSQVAYEALLYELTGPACKVVSIKLAPYRALYQDGYPVYPPMRLQVWIGASPYNLQPASPWHDVQASDALQTFALWPHAPIGRYLQVRMYGKLQKQREDMKFYTAIRHVDITGAALTAPELLALQPLLRSNTLQLAAPTPAAPASCFDALQAAADFGVGPEQLSASTGASGFAVTRVQAVEQQLGARGQWVKLVARPRVLQVQAQSKHGASHAQVQQQDEQQQQRGSAVQRVTAGIRSILGRRGATAAAVAGPSEAGPSKKPQQQQQPPPAPPLPGQGQGRQQHQQRQRMPLWLADEAAAAAVLPALFAQQQEQGSAGHVPMQAGVAVAGETQGDQLVLQQEQQGDEQPSSISPAGASAQQQDSADHSMNDVEQHATVVFQHQQQQLLQQQQQLYQQEYQLFRGDDSDRSDGYEEDDSSSDYADEDVEGYVNPDFEAQQQPVGRSALGAAAFEAAQRLTQQIALRLQNVPPWQQEQVLAELLADEPSGGRAGRQAYRQHLADMQAQLRQQQQGEQETDPLLGTARGPPVVAILPDNSINANSSSGSSGYHNSSVWCDISSSSGQQDAEWVIKGRVVLDQHIPVAQWFHGESMIESITGVQEDQWRLRQRYSAAVYAAMRAAAAGSTDAATAAVAVAAGGAGPNSSAVGVSASEAPAAAAAASAAAAAAAAEGMSLNAAVSVSESGALYVGEKQDAGAVQQQDANPGRLFGFADVGPAAAATTAVASKACPPVLTAGHLFEWQMPGCCTASSSSSAVGSDDRQAGFGSCSSSVSASAQKQWLAPASCFCEGWEADVCA